MTERRTSMVEATTDRQSHSALTERSVLRLGLALVAMFLLLAAASGLLPLGGLHGWAAIHLSLAAATTVAIGTFMPHFGVTLAGTRPEASWRRLAGVLALAIGMLGVTLGRPWLGDRTAAVGGLLVLVGVGLTAWNTYAPLRSGLARRHPIVQLTYGVSLADLVVGVSLAVLFLVGFEPITGAWARLKPAHVWLNAFGFVSLTIAATLIYLYPTMLGTRIRPHPTLVIAVAGLVLGPPTVALATTLGWDALAIIGGAGTLLGAVGLLGFGVDVWTRRGRWTTDLAWHALAARHGLAGMAWLVLTLASLVLGLLRDGGTAPGWTIGALAIPLIGGWAVQELVAAWGHLLPTVGPGTMAVKARQREVLSRWGTARVVAWNGGLAVLWPGVGFGIPPLGVAGVGLFGTAAAVTLGLFVAALRSRPSARGATA